MGVLAKGRNQNILKAVLGRDRFQESQSCFLPYNFESQIRYFSDVLKIQDDSRRLPKDPRWRIVDVT